MRTSARRGWMWACALALAACGDDAGPGAGEPEDAGPRRQFCGTDRPCGEGRICVDRRCVPALPDATSPCPACRPEAGADDAGGWDRDATAPPDDAAPGDPDGSRPPPPGDAAPPPPDGHLPPDPTRDAGAPEPDAARPPPPDAMVPPRPPPRGVYAYERLAIGGLGEARAVAFAPDGRRALVLERTDVAHVVDWATLTARRFDLRPAGAHVYWEDLEYDPDGRRAVLVGWRLVNQAREGVVYHLDVAALEAGEANPFAERLRVPNEELAAIARPWAPGGAPVILGRSNQNRVATIRAYDPDAARFAGLVAAHASGAGCQDLAPADNELGGPGWLVVCGINGAQVLYYTEIGGIGEWRVNPGNGNLGNLSRAAARPGGEYALFISWSGRRVMRFEAGLTGRTEVAPEYRTRGIWGVTFQPDGRRALVYGQAGGDPLTGTVIEYRHPFYAAGELTEVHIPNFAAAPYNGSNATNLNDAAFRPGCDGGLLVGGESNAQGSRGLIIRFQVENGRACR